MIYRSTTCLNFSPHFFKTGNLTLHCLTQIRYFLFVKFLLWNESEAISPTKVQSPKMGEKKGIMLYFPFYLTFLANELQITLKVKCQAVFDWSTSENFNFESNGLYLLTYKRALYLYLPAWTCQPTTRMCFVPFIAIWESSLLFPWLLCVISSSYSQRFRKRIIWPGEALDSVSLEDNTNPSTYKQIFAMKFVVRNSLSLPLYSNYSTCSNKDTFRSAIICWI